MKKQVWDFHPGARKELDAAADIYETARPGLGDAFADAVDAKLALAAQLPVPGVRVPNIDDEMVRQVYLRPRFPYRIVLVVDVSVVLAVAHMRRRPQYWRKRLRETRKKKRAVKKRRARGASAPRRHR